MILLCWVGYTVSTINYKVQLGLFVRVWVSSIIGQPKENHFDQGKLENLGNMNIR